MLKWNCPMEFDGRALGEVLDFLPPDRRQHTLKLRNVTQPSTPTLFKIQCTALGEVLDFLPPDRRQHTLKLRNVTQPSTPTLFKIQCTAPHKLRVRPTLGVLTLSGDMVSIQVQLNPQEFMPATCKLLVVGRRTSSLAVQGDYQLKSLWADAEDHAEETLLLSETINVRIQSATANDDKSMTLLPTTTQLAELVLLLMKSYSRRKENELTTPEQEQLKVARALHASEWPYWEEYAVRMRKLLRERNKRKTQTF